MFSKVISSVGTICFAFLFFIDHTKAEITHTVNENDTLWTIAMDHGVSVLDIKKENNKSTNAVTVGEQLTIPEGITPEEEELLARLVSAEAKGEPYAGKVAVATVVLNRVNSPEFPNSIKEVIYEVSPTGNPSFTPVQNGTINQPADKESKKAVKEALAFEGQGHGSLFFYNPEKATNHWIATRETTTIIGNHIFAR
ncbi:cell wall hydrolase [Aliibacillus thermotolerans]|uniref:Cell wall hydrolase n=1 Tax=Aliibacillus thermotolerans TaxID=1834418 RepID=A0ABW0U5X0_9BACI|nr:cell wall hydrolase [Aliibacillus thermotolerans]MDA3128596.1 LysM peptidoglycan-binding domain-containing protein [Aliibacillus thermotolerans]